MKSVPASFENGSASFQGSANAAFELYPLRFRPAAPGTREWTANALRGAFGAAMKRKDADAYARYFAPVAPRGTAPSGFANPPRPFVFRFGDQGIGLNLFTTHKPPIDLFAGVMGELGLELANAPGLLRLPLAPREANISRLRVRFLTATELGKTPSGVVERAFMPEAAPYSEASGRSAEFGILARRIRDRISTLSALYGAGRLDIDFLAFGEMADSIRLAHCELTRVVAERVSKSTGQRHSLGGFTGFAEYEGSLTAFLPYLEAARYTGVGRQTVWGKGEIAVEEI